MHLPVPEPRTSYLLVIPSLDLIVVRFGDQLYRESSEEMIQCRQLLMNLFNPVMDAIEEPPYPQSDLITAVEFAPAETVIRLAQGSDNWPATWAGDDHLIYCLWRRKRISASHRN